MKVEDVCMDYKKMIRELLDMVEEEKFLRRVYIILSDYIKRGRG